MERREFLKNSCTYCLGAIVLGITVAELSSCTGGVPIYKTPLTSKVEVPLSSFLQSNIVIVRLADSEFDILLVKKSESEYTALLMECSHRNSPLTATKDGLYCPAHGSRFDLNGNVTEQPATQPLQKYKTSLTQTAVVVYTHS